MNDDDNEKNFWFDYYLLFLFLSYESMVFIWFLLLKYERLRHKWKMPYKNCELIVNGEDFTKEEKFFGSIYKKCLYLKKEQTIITIEVLTRRRKIWKNF